MCLYVKVKIKRKFGIFKKEQKAPDFLTAEKDIVCYKILEKSNNTEVFYSYLRGFLYRFNQRYNTSISFTKRRSFFLINRGFHSWVEKPEKEFSNSVIVKCVIPKGTKFIKGEQHDDNSGYVSASIIIKEIINKK